MERELRHAAGDVARDSAPNRFIAAAKTARGDAQQIQRGRRILAHAGFKMLAIQAQQLEVG